MFRNRLYDQRNGRWTQEDPIGVDGGVNLYQFNGNNPATYTDPFGLCPEFITGKPCSTAVAIVVGLIPVVGDAIDIAGAASGEDLLTGEKISGLGVAATIVGTLVGSGKLAREGVDVAEEVVERTAKKLDGAVEAAKKRRDIPDRRKPHRTEPSPSKREKHEDTRAPHKDKKRQHDTWRDNPNKR